MKKYLKQKKPLTLKKALLIVRNPHNRIVTFLHNMGGDLESVVADLNRRGVNVNMSYLLDADHWHFKQYADEDAFVDLPSGRVAYFVFYYQAGYHLEVKA